MRNISYGVLWSSLAILLIIPGCSKIPCYRPEHFVPPPHATYRAEAVSIETLPGHVLAGTLTLPLDSAPPHPAVVLITGSSPQNRDHLGSRWKPACHYRPFRQIADTLSTNGIAVLRMDDRGTGCSGGDALEIDEGRIGLLGLSEGGRWFRSFIKYMPLPTAQNNLCPALILHGDKDAHVPVDHAHLLAQAMRTGGNRDVTVLILKNHNHLFLEDPVGNISGYKDLSPHTNQLSDQILDTITGWLQERLAKK